MRQIVVLSGKGGTGKTSVTAALAHLESLTAPAVLVDADVDAANLSLVLGPRINDVNKFLGGSLAEIDAGQCSNCGACVQVCRYDAILPDQAGRDAMWVDPIACDGCAACVYACPQQAIQMIPQQEGEWFRSGTDYGALFHAELFAGRENSGKLVTIIRQHARLFAEESQIGHVIIDGPPGIGCPVISACAGADLGLLVTEPGLTGLHDLKRVLGTLKHFRIPAVICINKADIDPGAVQATRDFAQEEGIPIAGEIPYSESIPRAMLAGQPVTLHAAESNASEALRMLHARIHRLLEEN